MLRQLLTRIERARALDGISDRLQAAVQAVAKPQRYTDKMHRRYPSNGLTDQFVLRCVIGKHTASVKGDHLAKPMQN